MNRTPTPNPMDDALDRMVDAHLSTSSDELTPSSGFVASVMDSIHAQAVEPPPIAFPWRRVLPGAIAILCALCVLVVFVVRGAVSHVPGAPVPSHWTQTLSFAPGGATFLWLALAACLSVAAIVVSLRLTRHSD